MMKAGDSTIDQPPTFRHDGAKDESRDELIRWLQGQASERSGFQDFVGSHHHVQQNADAAWSWLFSADFAQKHHKQTHHLPLVCQILLSSECS